MAANSPEDRERELALETFKVYMARYNAIFPRVPQDLQIYSTINVALLGGLVLLVHDKLFQACFPNWFVYPTLVVLDGMGIVLVAWLGRVAAKSSNDAWTRTIAVLGKLEARLGLHTSQDRLPPIHSPGQMLWPTEPTVYPLFRDALWRSKGSKGFVDEVWRSEDHSTVVRVVFCVWAAIGFGLITFGLAFYWLNLSVGVCNQ